MDGDRYGPLGRLGEMQDDGSIGDGSIGDGSSMGDVGDAG
jgi:hypothetical protein